MPFEFISNFISLLYAPPPAGTPWWIVSLEFIASIVSSLAWPAVVVVVVLIFKRPIVDALENLKSFKWGDKEAVFGRELKELVEKSEAIEVVDEQVASLNSARLVQLIEMAAVSPTGAIVEAWKDVVEAVSQLAIPSGGLSPEAAKNVPANVLMRVIVKNELLPRAEIETFDELRSLRNRAAHGPVSSISVEQARQYVRVADRLVDAIRKQVAELPF